MRTAPMLAATALVAALAPLGLTTTATAAAPTCQGRAATIPDATRIYGTSGPDVIVTSKAELIETFDGDDLVCVSTQGLRAGSLALNIYTGAGNDTVDTTATRAVDWIDAVLGPGGDRYAGGVAGDQVTAGSMLDGTHADTHRDVIRLGPRTDTRPNAVVSGQTGHPNADSVTGTGGPDRMLVSGVPAAGATFTPAGGLDNLTWMIGDGQHHLDLARRTMTAGATTGPLPAAFEGYTVDSELSTLGHLDVTGTSGDDTVDANLHPQARLRATMKGGHDRVLLANPPFVSGSRILGGTGRDRVATGVTRGSIVLDLAKGTMQVDTHTVRVAGFEDADLVAPRVVARGTSAANAIKVDGCRVRVATRGGADTIESGQNWTWQPYFFSCPSRDVVMRGGAGNDQIAGSGAGEVLRGGPGRDRIWGLGGRDRLYGEGGADTLGGGAGADLIVGGGGRDTAHGGPQVDTCRTEVRRTCERR